MNLPITALYGGLCGLLVLLLALRIPVLRAKYRVDYGDGGQPTLLHAIRAHGNAVEYVPLVLILMAAAESLGSSAIWLHLVGIGLLAGRVLHAGGLMSGLRLLRGGGILLTFAALGAIAVLCIARAIQALSIP